MRACVCALPCHSRPRFGCSGLGSCTLFQNKVHTCRILLQHMYIFTYQNHKYHEYPHHPMLHSLLGMPYYQTIADVCVCVCACFSVWAMSNDAIYSYPTTRQPLDTTLNLVDNSWLSGLLTTWHVGSFSAIWFHTTVVVVMQLDPASGKQQVGEEPRVLSCLFRPPSGPEILTVCD